MAVCDAIIFSSGSWRPMMPVEAMSTDSGRPPRRAAMSAVRASAVRVPLVAGAGVGVGRVDEDRPDGAADARPAQLNRRGGDLVGGEYAGGVAGRVGSYQAVVEPAGVPMPHSIAEKV